MPQHDVFVSPNGRGYVLDIQSDLLDEIGTRVVVPLVRERQAHNGIRRLNPILMLDGQRYVMMTHLIATVPAVSLTEVQGNLAASRDLIVSALDMLHQRV